MPFRGKHRNLRALFTMIFVLAVGLAACNTADVDPEPTDAPDVTDVTEAPPPEDDPEPTDEEPEPTTPENGEGTLRIQTLLDIQTLDPARYPGITEANVGNAIYEGLLAFDPNSGEVVNILAETFDASDDGLRYDFKLKEGIQFHGGYGELTAEDVKFSFERVAGLYEEYESFYSSLWAGLTEVVVHDTYSGTIVFSEPFPPLINLTLTGQGGLVLSKAAVEERGVDYDLQPIGTGKYQFDEFRPQDRTILQRFPEYSGADSDVFPEAAWETIEFVNIPEPSAAEIALESGEVDVASVSSGAFDRFEESNEFETHSLPTADYSWLSMNVTHPSLEDIRVRQAIRAAIDLDSTLLAGFDGVAAINATSIISPTSPLGYWEDAPPQGGDSELARQLLDEAGIEEGELKLELIVSPQTSQLLQAQVIQENLGEIGIEVELRVIQLASFGDEVSGQHGQDTNQLVMAKFTSDVDPSYSTEWFTCEWVQEWNYMYWCNEEYSQLHVEALSETDEETRHQMYIRMQELMYEDAVAVWLAHPSFLWANNRDVDFVANRVAQPYFPAMTVAG